MAQLSRHEDDIGSFCDQEARERVPEVVEPEPGCGSEPSAGDCDVQASADDVPVVERRPVTRAEHEVLRPRTPDGEARLAVRTKHPSKRRHELDVTNGVSRLRRNTLPR